MSPRRFVSTLARSCAVSFALVLAGDAFAAQTRGFVYNRIQNSATLSVVDLATRAVTQNVVTSGVCTDARLRWFGDRLYVLGRFGCNNITVYNSDLTLHGQFSTGGGTNPSDIVLLSPTKAYVPCYDSSNVLIVNPDAGTIVGRIPLGFFDPDGVPDMDFAIRIGDRVFVALQRLDNFNPRDHSLVAVIDARADTVVDVDPGTSGVQGIRLTGTNPFTSFSFDPASRRLLIGCVGSFFAIDGGIEWVDPFALRSDGFAVTEAVLGGNVLDVAWNGPQRSYAIIDSAAFDSTRLVSWSSATGTRIGPVHSVGGFNLSDCALDDRGELYLCDRTPAAPGLFVYATSNDQRLAGPLPTGPPPAQIVFDEPDNVTGVTPLATARLEPPIPNPTRDVAAFAFFLPHDGRIELEVFDLSGRSVRKIFQEAQGSVRNTVRWDLRDASGHRVRPGIYLVRASSFLNSVKKTDGNFLVSRIIVL